MLTNCFLGALSAARTWESQFVNNVPAPDGSSASVSRRVHAWSRHSGRLRAELGPPRNVEDASSRMLETLRSFFEPPIAADRTQSTAKLVWIVRLRWIALTAQLLSIPFSLHFQLLESELLSVFVGVIAALATVNFVTWAALRRGAQASPGRLLFQLAADIAAISGLLALTGGAWNPLVPILFVHTGLGALLLEGQLSLLFFTLLIGCLVLLQAYSHIPPGLEGSLVPTEILMRVYSSSC